MDYTPLIEKRRQRLEELETVIAEPDFFNDQKKASEIMREHRRLKELMETWDSLNATERTADNQELAKTDDPGWRNCAGIPNWKPRWKNCDDVRSLLPRDTTEDRDAIIEIRAERAGMASLLRDPRGCTSVL
ncbi:MAG: PCRF domain-containing protein [Akkermansia sp.]